jgi:membrane-associated phospholipid phosphatase
VDTPGNAFPSIHVAIAVLTALITWSNNRWLGVVFILTALGIAVATLYVKQHWALDVVAGALLGAGTHWIVYRRRLLNCGRK